MPPGHPLHILLFGVSCGLLFLAALAVPRDSGPGGSDRTPRESAAPVGLQALRTPAAQRAPRQLQRAARRFLAAFLRYEVGNLGQTTTKSLRAHSSPDFAAELLAQPPRDLYRHLPRAQIWRLRVIVLSQSPGRALVSGSALRDGRPEQFSFFFEADGGAWRAVGPGE
jgi:hypothetical protein